jgi:hypothetical protein
LALSALLLTSHLAQRLCCGPYARNVAPRNDRTQSNTKLVAAAKKRRQREPAAPYLFQIMPA